MARPIVNLAVTIVVLMIFEQMHWVTVSGAGAARPEEAAHFVDLLLVGVLMFEIGEIMEFLFFTCLVGVIPWVLALVPMYWLMSGFARLEGARRLLPGGPDWFTYTDEVVPIFLMAGVLGATRWHLSRARHRRRLVEDDVEVRIDGELVPESSLARHN